MKGRTPRGLAVLASTVLVGVVLAACGGGGSTTTSTTTSTTNAANTQRPSGATGSTSRTALEACLKKYGVTLPAGGGFGGGFGGRFGASGASGRRFPFGATGASGRRFPFGATGASGRRFPFGATGASGRRFPFGGTGASGAFGGNSKLAKALQKCGGFGGGFGGGRFGASGGGGPAGFSTQIRTEITSFVTCMRKNGESLPSPNFSGTGSVFGNVNESTATFKAAYAKCQGILTYLHRRAPATGATGSTTT